MGHQEISQNSEKRNIHCLRAVIAMYVLVLMQLFDYPIDGFAA
jgi:hypothetical protein